MARKTIVRHLGDQKSSYHFGEERGYFLCPVKLLYLRIVYIFSLGESKKTIVVNGDMEQKGERIPVRDIVAE